MLHKHTLHMMYIHDSQHQTITLFLISQTASQAA